MRVHGVSQHGSLSSVLRVCVPLLLIGFLLYNPFVSLVSPTDGLAYQQVQRHRATVGASELQHFSPVQGLSAEPVAVPAELFAKPVVATRQPFDYPSQTTALLPRPELIESIWFRPPPAA